MLNYLSHLLFASFIHCASGFSSSLNYFGCQIPFSKGCTLRHAFLDSNLIIQAGVGLATYCGLIAHYDRVRGTLILDDKVDLEVKDSQVCPGMGLYIKKDFPENTVIGTYPGRVLRARSYMSKYERMPKIGTYAWRFTDNIDIIDPTDRDGELQERCFGGADGNPVSYIFHEKILRKSVSTYLCRINEPPIGGTGCNVRSREDLEKREVTFELSRDVYGKFRRILGIFVFYCFYNFSEIFQHTDK